MQALSAPQLHAQCAAMAPLLLDVREDWELAIASIRPEGAELRHVPMGQIVQRLDELPTQRPIVCLCHHGVRSQQVAAFLERQGFEQVFNLSGGIDAWSCQVDPSVARY